VARGLDFFYERSARVSHLRVLARGCSPRPRQVPARCSIPHPAAVLRCRLSGRYPDFPLRPGSLPAPAVPGDAAGMGSPGVAGRVGRAAPAQGMEEPRPMLSPLS